MSTYDPQRVSRLQQTRLARIVESRQLYKAAQQRAMSFYKQEAKLDQNDIYEYQRRVADAELRAAAEKQLLTERAWDALPNAKTGVVVRVETALDKERIRKQEHLLQKMSIQQRADDALRLMNEQKVSERVQRQRQVAEEQAAFQKEKERQHRVVQQQKFRDEERKRYYLEEELARNSLEARIQQRTTAAFVETVKEVGIPLLHTKKAPNYQIVVEDHPEHQQDHYAVDAYQAAAVQIENVPVKEEKKFDTRAVVKQQRISKLAAEGISILEAISGL